MKILTLLFIASISSAYANSPRICNDSKSPLYSADANDDLEIDIISDFNHINGTKIDGYRPYAPGVLTYKKEDGTSEYMAIQVEARGNSRYNSCEWRPLKLVFEGEKLSNKLFDNINFSGNQEQDLSNMYSALIDYKGVTKSFGYYKKLNRFKLFIGESNKKNIFKKAGKEVRLVSHCGDASWYENGHQVLGGKTKDIQNRKVLQEHYIYQILNTLKSTTLKTRLLTINYRNIDGSLNITRKGFFIEDASKMAKRCNLEKGRGNSKNKQSSFQLDLLNKFVFSNDYYLNENEEHNMILFHDENKESFLIGYDYDLSGLIQPLYKKNIDTNLDQHRDNIYNWLVKYDFGDVEIPTIKALIEKKSEMNLIISKSFLDIAFKNDMNYWINSYTDMLKNYVELKEN